jgi:hypothetical protein
MFKPQYISQQPKKYYPQDPTDTIIPANDIHIGKARIPWQVSIFTFIKVVVASDPTPNEAEESQSEKLNCGVVECTFVQFISARSEYLGR